MVTPSVTLGIGVTSAVFQAKALIIDVNDGRIARKHSLVPWIGILSIPEALPLAIDVTIFAAMSTVKSEGRSIYIYKIIRIVRALSLVNSCVKMRVWNTAVTSHKF